MKAITLHEPWATAVAMGLKHWETRGWSTKHRGWIAIHAAATVPKYAREFYLRTQGEVFEVPSQEQWNCGRIVAVAKLADILEITLDLPCTMTEQEVFWGNWTPGRYAWKLENVTRLSKPIVAKGAQRIWNCDGLCICGICGGPQTQSRASCTCDGGIRLLAE